jgi:hypothetical protein
LWPALPTTISSSVQPEFDVFLAQVSTVMCLKPSTEGAVLVFDKRQIHDDLLYVQHFNGDLTSAMKSLISLRQEDGAANRLRPAALPYFKNFPRYEALSRLACDGAAPILREGFQPNAGMDVEPLRPQFHKLRSAIQHQLAKLHHERKGIVLPKSLVAGWASLHLNPSHVVLKVGDTKGRVCMDPRSSGLNDGTDLEAIYSEIGNLSLPSVRDVASTATSALTRGDILISKFDISAAFTQYKLSWEAAVLQAIDLDDLVFIPIVGMFGWTASPGYYDLISKAVDWAHRGGIATTVLDELSLQQDKVVVLRQPEWITHNRLHRRSITYVDDTIIFSGVNTVAMDISDFEVVTHCLLGPVSVNPKKTEGPASRMEVIGWTLDMIEESIGPSLKGICKMMHYIFDVMRPPVRSVTIVKLESLVGVLRHYSLVMPLLYGTLSHLQGQLIKARNSTVPVARVNLTAASLSELAMWRIMLEAGLANRSLWTCPLSFIQRTVPADALQLVTDASQLFGGGYVLQGISYGHWLWSVEEQECFVGSDEHINVLELAVLVLAILANVDHLRNRCVHAQIDNTSALCWTNALRSKTPSAQPWIKLLLLTCVSYNIHICATHIRGIDNTVADGLSRDFQEIISRLGRTTLLCRPPLTSTERLVLFRMTSGGVGSCEQWNQVRNVLTTQGVEPSTNSVICAISNLVSSTTR